MGIAVLFTVIMLTLLLILLCVAALCSCYPIQDE